MTENTKCLDFRLNHFIFRKKILNMTVRKGIFSRDEASGFRAATHVSKVMTAVTRGSLSTSYNWQFWGQLETDVSCTRQHDSWLWFPAELSFVGYLYTMYTGYKRQYRHQLETTAIPTSAGNSAQLPVNIAGCTMWVHSTKLIIRTLYTVREKWNICGISDLKLTKAMQICVDKIMPSSFKLLLFFYVSCPNNGVFWLWSVGLFVCPSLVRRYVLRVCVMGIKKLSGPRGPLDVDLVIPDIPLRAWCFINTSSLIYFNPFSKSTLNLPRSFENYHYHRHAHARTHTHGRTYVHYVHPQYFFQEHLNPIHYFTGSQPAHSERLSCSDGYCGCSKADIIETYGQQDTCGDEAFWARNAGLWGR